MKNKDLVGSDAPVLAYEHAVETEDTLTIYDYCEIRDVDSLRTCPYCMSTNVVYPRYVEDIGLCRCGYCGWWKLLNLNDVSHGFGKVDVRSKTAIVKRFPVSSLEVPLRALRGFLGKHPNHMAYVNPNVFEKLMADCLRDAYFPCEVVHVGRSDDGGIDLKLVITDDVCYLVQVKRRKNLDKKEGVEVVRSLNGVLFKEGIPKGMVITTARAFTTRALESTTIKTPTAVPYDMKLLAFDEVKSMLKLTPVLPYEPWKRYKFKPLQP